MNEYNPGVLSPSMTKAEAIENSMIKQLATEKERNKYKWGKNAQKYKKL